MTTLSLHPDSGGTDSRDQILQRAVYLPLDSLPAVASRREGDEDLHLGSTAFDLGSLISLRRVRA